MTISELQAKFEGVATDLESFGGDDLARAVRETARRCSDYVVEYWNESLSIPEAAAWGGYSKSQLQRLLKEQKIQRSTDGGIRRRHVPIQPGHEPPLGIEPALVGVASIADGIAKQRTAR